MKKRLVFTGLISIILIVVLMIGSTYSLFVTSNVDDNLNVYKTGNLNVTYTVSDNNKIYSSSIPVSSGDVDRVKPYRITVNNVGNVPYKFNVILNNTTATDSVDSKYVVTKVGKLEPKTLDNCDAGVIKDDVIVPAGESAVIDVRVYLNETIENTEIGKSFFANLSIDGVAIYNENDEIDNSILMLPKKTLVSYDSNGGIIINGDENKVVESTSKYGDLPTVERVGYTFSGWYTEEGVQVTSDSDLVIEDDHILVAKWNAISYTVTFDANGGIVTPTSKSIVYEDEYGDLPTPTKANNVFVGWFTELNGGKLVTSTSDVIRDENHTLYAHWTNDCVVTFDANKGDVEPSSIIVKEGKEYGSLPTPTRGGYDFTGWYTGVTGGEKITESTIVNTGVGADGKTCQTHVLYAHWSAKTYTVSYDINYVADSETAPPASKTVTYDELYGDLPTVERVGYTFEGWYSEPDGGTKIESSSKVVALSNHTLYAHWNMGSYTVTFDDNDNDASTNAEPTSKTVFYGQEYGELAEVEDRSGYTFLGWYTSKSGGSQVTETTVVNVSSPHTLYAHWEVSEVDFYDQTLTAGTYDTVYNSSFTGASNGTGTYTYAITGVKLDGIAVVASNGKYNGLVLSTTTISGTPTKSGTYVFTIQVTDSGSGSKKSANITIVINKKEVIAPTSLTVSAAGIVTFSGAINATGYEISIDGSNWTTFTSGSSYLSTIIASTGSRTVYIRAVNSDTTNYLSPSNNKTAEVTVFAVTIASNNTAFGTVDTASYNVISGAIYSTSGDTLTFNDGTTTFKTVKATKIDLSGYFTSLSGWTPTGGTITEATMITANFVRTPNTYIVTLNANGGSVTPTSVEVTYGSNYGSLPDATRDGYEFDGWYTAASGGTKIESSTIVSITAAQTLYAHWNENSYTIAYTCNGGVCNGPTSGTYDTDVQISNPTKSITVTGNVNGTGATIVAASPTSQTFAGWTSNSNEGLGNSAKTGTASNPTTAWTGSATKNTYFRNLSDTSGTVTLTATWTPVAVKLPTVTKPGFTCGWNESSSGTTITYGSGENYTPNKTTGEDVTMYAVCKANTAKITIKEDGVNAATTGYSISLSTSDTSDTATFSGTTTGATITFNNVVSGQKYYIWAGKSDNAKTTRAYSGVEITATNGTTSGGNVNGTINYYTLTLIKGTGISTLTGAGKYLSTQNASIGATVSVGYTFGGWTVSTGGNAPTSSVLANTTVSMSKMTSLTASAIYSATPIIELTDYNTFTYSADGASAYYVSTSSTEPSAGSTAASSTFALNTWTTATSTGNLSLSSGQKYYVWAKDNTIDGSVSSNKSIKEVRTITRTQGTGTTLTTKYQSSSGTSFAGTVYVLDGTTIWASSSPNSGYRTATLTMGGTSKTASGDTAIATANMSVVSSATANEVKVNIYKDGALWDASGMKVTLYNGTTATSYTATASSGSQVTISAVPNGTYNIYAGKNSLTKTTLLDSGVDVTVNDNSPNAVKINYYTLTLAKGTGVYTVSQVSQTSTLAVQHLYNSSSPQSIAINATLYSGYNWSTWTKTAGTSLTTFTAVTKSQSIKMGAGATTLTASATFGTPTITTSDYNTFTYAATAGKAYYVSTSSTKPSAGSTAASSTFALNTWTTATSTGNLSLSKGQTYYVWAKSLATGGTVSSSYASIAVREITRSQGTGTTLTTKHDYNENDSGTVFTGTLLVLNGTVIWAEAKANSDGLHGGAVLKHGSTTMSSSGESFTVNASETISSSLKTVTLTYDCNGATTSSYGSSSSSSGICFSANSTTTLNYMQEGVVTSDVPILSGSGFAGWSIEEDGVAVKKPGDSIQITEDTTLHAVWGTSNYSVSGDGWINVYYLSSLDYFFDNNGINDTIRKLSDITDTISESVIFSEVKDSGDYQNLYLNGHNFAIRCNNCVDSIIINEANLYISNTSSGYAALRKELNDGKTLITNESGSTLKVDGVYLETYGTSKVIYNKGILNVGTISGGSRAESTDPENSYTETEDTVLVSGSGYAISSDSSGVVNHYAGAYSYSGGNYTIYNPSGATLNLYGGRLYYKKSGSTGAATSGSGTKNTVGDWHGFSGSFEYRYGDASSIISLTNFSYRKY